MGPTRKRGSLWAFLQKKGSHLDPFILKKLKSTLWTRHFGLKFDISTTFQNLDISLS